jgi:SAM-dependent methyltransferase
MFSDSHTMLGTNCNLCGSDSTSTIIVQNNYKVEQCKHCSLVYMNPRPHPLYLLKLYNDYHQRDGKDEAAWARLMERNYNEVSSLLNCMLPGKGSLLDIGCGYGHFLKKMRNQGWIVAGIEPATPAGKLARAEGLAVAEITIEETEFPRNSFDAITAFYVLEHLFDPLSALKKIQKMLKPGGVLVLRIPHTTPLIKLLAFFKIRNNLYDLPFHLYDFSPRTIRLLLEKAGFIAVRTTPGRPTIPKKFGERLLSRTSGVLSRSLFALSRGRILLPGTSKTVIALSPVIKSKDN